MRMEVVQKDVKYIDTKADLVYDWAEWIHGAKPKQFGFWGFVIGVSFG
jgi:hypothetical protein